MPNAAINALLAEADVFIANAQDGGPIQAAFEEIGRGPDYFAAGQSLLGRARTLSEQQQAEYGEKRAATDHLHAQRREAAALYMRHLRLARIALRGDTEARTALEMGGQREQDLEGWIAQARIFYSNIAGNERIAQALATEVGIDAEDVSAAQEEVADVSRAYEARLAEKGEAEDATEQRDAAVDRLGDWVRDGQALARVLLEDQPQQLEKLGLLARS